jgi:fructan beta-fructosidase
MLKKIFLVTSFLIFESLDFYGQSIDSLTHKELFRPQYHFTAKKGWMNDPNGLFFYNHTYHNFYQFNPFGNEWGHMSWAHSISKDLVHWKSLPLAIAEGPDGMIFSGSIVVDSFNRSGLGAMKGPPPIIAVYTRFVTEKQDQCLAYSLDSGFTWNKYPKNPILDLNLKDFRDPKIFWMEKIKAWVMVVSIPFEKKVLFYQSQNLLNWALAGNYSDPLSDGFWECPDLFPLKTNSLNESGNLKWVLLLSLGQKNNSNSPYTRMVYYVGDFNGKQFQTINQNRAISFDFGKDFYAGSTFNGIPNQRRILFGWMSDWAYGNNVPTTPWKSSQSLPRDLSIKEINGEFRIFQNPIQEIKNTRKLIFEAHNTDTKKINQEIKSENIYGKNLEIEISLYSHKSSLMEIYFRKGTNEFTKLSYNSSKKKLILDRTHSGNSTFDARFPSQESVSINTKKEILDLDLWIDDNSVEIFADGGSAVITDLIFPKSTSQGFSLQNTGTPLLFKSIKIYQIPSIWQ